MQATIQIRGYDVEISDADVVNLSEFTFSGGDIRTFVALDHGFVVGIVFASNEQDAIDELADSGRLDRWKLAPEELRDYGETEEEQWERLGSLGNAGEPFDIEGMMLEEIRTPRVSFVACVKAQEETCAHPGCDKPRAKDARVCSIEHAAVAQWKREGKL